MRLGGGLHLSTQVVNIPKGSRLGTSSILAGACVKALTEFLDQKLSDNELYNRVLCMEQIMSTGGGWQDQVGGLALGVKMITSEAGIEQKISCTTLRFHDKIIHELNERFCLIYTGQRRLARNLLREVVGKYIGGHRDAVDTLCEMQRIAALMRFELEKGCVDRFARLLSEHWELSKRLDAGSTNTCIDQIFLTIDDLIDGKMICGAGGGGFLQVILKKGIAKEQLRVRLLDVFQDSGVDVWNCELNL
jgi:fucokinase